MFNSTVRNAALAGLFLMVFLSFASPLFGADDALPPVDQAEQVAAGQAQPEQAPQQEPQDIPQQAPKLPKPKPELASQHASVFPLGSTVPPSAQKAIESKINRLTGGIRETFSVWLARSGKYISVMEEIFEEKGLPTDLVFLPLIESGYNPFAVSSQAAAGPWQFMAGTARSYGLAINWWTDERRDPVKATAAAAQYLKELYNTFGSWPLALASYNAGEGCVARAMAKTKTNDYWRLTQAKALPRQTMEYVPLYMAATMIAKNPADHGFEIRRDETFEFDEVILNNSLQLGVAARCAGTSLEKMRELNPALTRDVTPPYKNYILRIPKGTEANFRTALAKLSPEERRAWDRVEVKKGDNMQKLAKRYNLSVEALKEINSMDGKFRLKAGDYILVPKSTLAAHGVNAAQTRSRTSKRG